MLVITLPCFCMPIILRYIC